MRGEGGGKVCFEYCLSYRNGFTINSARTWVFESAEFKPLNSKQYSSAPIHLEISGKQQSLYLKFGKDWDNNSGLRNVTICLPEPALSSWLWLNEFRIGKMGAELSTVTSRHRHICNIRIVCENAIWDERTLLSGLISGSRMWQYTFPRPEVCESMFSSQLSGLCSLI